MSREHTVRAAGADRSLQKFVLGKFPGDVPDLRAPGEWRLARQDEAVGGGWALEGGPAAAAAPTKFKGAPDSGGLSGATPSNYFILIKQRGSDDFLAIPVSEWATFKPVTMRGEINLEDAEAQMKHRRLQAERANLRLAEAIGVTEAAEPGGAGVPAGDDDADSDAEWKDIKARAASLAAAAPGGVGRPGSAGAQKPGPRDYDDAGAAPPLTMDEAVYVPKPVDAEDWEHESQAADDDLEMGSGSDGEVEASPVPRPAVSDSDGEGDMDASKVKRAIRRMMRDGGLNDSEGSGASDEDGDDDDDDAEDEEDLDRMADEFLPGQVAAGAAPAAAAAAAVEMGGGGKKRKASPPPAAAPVKEEQQAQTAPKRARVEPAAAAALGMPTDAEVVELLHSRGRMLLKEIVSEFGARLSGGNERKQFSQIVKRVAKLDPTTDDEGRKFLVLK